ncbi:hypothetical protein LX15_001397 [Streptoalloteichus tenebrarius]|uniref:Uncharacterized protein n=1 Tax=Streptoalloteichus tenebrarius (strain ATCC 17920 / DSM 40477 / JCM 4838 / CBS 697.72 / NBRC 16177 / NCIMB 11028 / NRRL B-12390 / A12253. 1 / ISP 5477) TaxID=1933 RepID=A0ABT1HQB6_STRSD|nr:hypothetical protein [Streptoalloteichus tenebrarius]MCP2257711.1 hypothetical protein [Streptoalloteichus tenebrarius]BFE99935.1 hypothetical protein GCM10020241_16110 [Streptoalloteichus tenebrarius]
MSTEHATRIAVGPIRSVSQDEYVATVDGEEHRVLLPHWLLAKLVAREYCQDELDGPKAVDAAVRALVEVHPDRPLPEVIEVDRLVRAEHDYLDHLASRICGH